MKSKKLHGPFGQFWREMFSANALLDLKLRAACGLSKTSTQTEVKDQLHVVFHTDSLAKIAPARFIAWVDHHGATTVASAARKITKRLKPEWLNEHLYGEFVVITAETELDSDDFILSRRLPEMGGRYKIEGCCEATFTNREVATVTRDFLNSRQTMDGIG